MPTGVIKFYNSNKGYGFIAQEQGEDIFFHISSSDIENPENLTPGQPVSFEMEDGTKGQQATQINILGTIDNQIPADKEEKKELTQKPIAGPKKKNFGELYIEKQIRLKTPMVFETYSESIPCTVKKHLTFDLDLLCGAEKRKISKLDVKYCYKQEYEQGVKANIQLDESIKSQTLQPVKPIKERYQIRGELLQKATSEKSPIQLVLRGGELFLGTVGWCTPYEIKVEFPRGDISSACDRTRCENPASGGNVIAFRHAVYDFALLNGNVNKTTEEPSEVKEKETQEPQEVGEKETKKEPSKVKDKNTEEEQSEGQPLPAGTAQEIEEKEEVTEKIYKATITKEQAEQGIKAIIPLQDGKKIAIPLPVGVSDGNRFRVKNRNMIVVVSVEG